MAVNRSILGRLQEFTSCRLELHRHTELDLEESWTSDYVAGKLESFGVPVHRGLAETGVVATLRGVKGLPSSCASRWN